MARSKPSGPASLTSRDVARAANVSQALVSRAFSGNGRIAPETRDHILEVARQIGWQPNALARSMVTGDAPLVAMITTRINFDWRAQVLSHLLKAIQEWHLKPLLFYAENDDEVDRLLGDTIGWRTRGVIVTAGAIAAHRAEAILSRGQFLAALNRPANHPDAFAIATNNSAGGATAARLLLEEGRRRFLVLAGQPHSWASSVREKGFVGEVATHGEKPAVWYNDTMTVEAGSACARRFLELPPTQRPDAVFAANDALALGFLDGLRERVGIPDDLSLIGFDNLPAASWPPYCLTTFEQPLDEMVGRVVGYIDGHQQRDGEPPASGSRQEPAADTTIYCTPKIILRSTTRARQ